MSCEIPSRREGCWHALAVIGSVLAMLAAQGCGGSSPAGRPSSPAWATACLPSGKDRISLAPEYLGLGPGAASRLANRRDEQLSFAGGGGRCTTWNDDVFRFRPVAVVWSTPPGRSARSRIVAAALAVGGWGPGGVRTTHRSPASPLTIGSMTTTPIRVPRGSRVLSQIDLHPPAGGSAQGIAEVWRSHGRDGFAAVATGLAPDNSHNAYAIWLSNSRGDSRLLGFVSPGVGANRRLQTSGALPINASNFHKVLVTLETRSTPSSPGTIVLEGTFTRV